MKSGFCAATVLFCVLFLVSAAYSASQFVPDSAGPAYGQTMTSASASGAQPLCPEILRQRIAQFSPDNLLCRSNVESIELQLFSDMHLKALKTDEQRGTNGFLLWTGDIVGVKGGQLVLVVRNDLIFASVYLPSSIVQIRPVAMATGAGNNNWTASSQPFQGAGDSQDYIVRQLTYPWRTSGTARGSESIEAVRAAVRPGCNSRTALISGARKLVELVNLEREADGLPALAYSGQLAEAARRHVMDMASHDYFSHELSNGEKFWQNVFNCGYPVSEVGENLAVGIATPQEAFECLISSPDHRANILNSSYTQTGVGDAVNTATSYRYFWAEEFGAASAKSEQAMSLGANRPRT